MQFKERLVMTWGWIPDEADSGMVYCGDEESSGTREVNLEVVDNRCDGLDIEFSISFDFAELWNPASAFYSAVAEALSGTFEMDVDPGRLCGAYALVLMEPNAHSAYSEVVDSMDGSFDNSGGQFNGMGFLRFYSEEGGDITHEACCVIHLG